MNQLQNAVFEPITVGTRRRQTEEGTDYRGGPEAADTLFTPYVGFSLRIDIGEEVFQSYGDFPSCIPGLRLSPCRAEPNPLPAFITLYPPKRK